MIFSIVCSKPVIISDCVMVCVSLYTVNPVVESRDSGEDGGFLHKVAAQARNEAGDTVNLPGSLAVLTVQRAAGVTLDTEIEDSCFIHWLESLVD